MIFKVLANRSRWLMQNLGYTTGEQMEYCERLAICPFFNERLKALPATAEGFKKRYCLMPNLSVPDI